MAAGEIEHLEEKIDDVIHKFIGFLETRYLSTAEVLKPVDFSIKARYFTLDVISNVAFGEPFGDLDHDEDRFSYIQGIERVLPISAAASLFPSLIALTNFIRSPLIRKIIPSDPEAVGLGEVTAFASNKVAERFGPDKKVAKDMIGSFIHHGLSQSVIESETLIQILAGSDTSSTVLRATLLYIITNPPVYNALLAEISSSQISNPITDSEARQLPYLQATIREGLRMFPPAPSLLFRTVPERGDTICGHFVPEHTKIGINILGMTRNPQLWGPDAKIFRPERWLNRSPHVRCAHFERHEASL